MSKLFCKFFSDDETINSNFEFDSNLTTRNMLVEFLRKTNSVLNYNIEDITFMYNSTLINNQKYLDRPIKEIFKRNNNPKIKVIDSNNIVGGRY